MSATPNPANAADLEVEIGWLSSVIDARLKLYFGHECDVADIAEIEPPRLGGTSHYARFVSANKLGANERIALLLALLPHVRPQLLDVFFMRNETFDRRFTEFGGMSDQHGSRFLPTKETLFFIVAGGDLARRFDVEHLFDEDHVFRRQGVFELQVQNSADPPSAALIQLSEQYLALLTTGSQLRPAFGPDFPASLVSTELSWEDLVLHPGTRQQVAEIETWLDHGETLRDDWAMGPKIRPGYRALFHGPPGTGKTLTAKLLGKARGRDVYRIDLALVVSKYIGETEKNLDRVFSQAQRKDWILFFDEADAIFGKRSETTTAHDRYANQEVSYLLQRIEEFDGVVILASNRRDNVDEAFSRRFESVIYFPVPGVEEREALWNRAFSPKAQLAPSVDLRAIAEQHAFAGGAIVNVVRFASLEAIKAGTNVVTSEMLARGLRRERAKDGT